LTQNTAGVINNASNISPLRNNTVPSISNYIEQEVSGAIASPAADILKYVSKETHTQINGFVVSKMIETMDVLQDSLNQELLDKLEHNAKTRVTKIWQ
jgi:hypothetical protein